VAEPVGIVFPGCGGVADRRFEAALDAARASPARLTLVEVKPLAGVPPGGAPVLALLEGARDGLVDAVGLEMPAAASVGPGVDRCRALAPLGPRGLPGQQGEASVLAGRRDAGRRLLVGVDPPHVFGHVVVEVAVGSVADGGEVGEGLALGRVLRAEVLATELVLRTRVDPGVLPPASTLT